MNQSKQQQQQQQQEEASPLLNEKGTSSFSFSSSRRSTWLRVGGVALLGTAGSIFAIVRSSSASSSLFFLGGSNNAEERARLKPPAPARGSLRSSSSSSSKLGAAAAVEENVLKLGTGCSPLQQFLPFNDDATKNFHDVVGARIATKTMSNDFSFENALEMQPGSECGTFEVPLSSVAGMGAGEEFGFYLYSKTNSTFDINQRADIGCGSEGDVRCPVAESPSPLAEMQCTQAFKSAGNVFYNRVFDGTTLSYNWGTCDEECSVKNPQCPVEETSTATAADLYEEPKCEGGEVKTSGGYEFCYGSKGKTWEQAEEFCEGNNVHLVEPKSEAYSAAVDAVCGHDCTWLNLRCDGSNQSCDTSFDDWSWLGSDTKLADGKNNFIMGGDNTIYGGGQGETCGHWWYNKGTKSVWGPQYCSSTYYGALCLMKEPSPAQ